MRFLLSLLVAAGVTASLATAETSQTDTKSMSDTMLPATDSHISYMGRVDFADHQAHMGYPGIVFRFVYSGPAPTLKFKASSENCFFNLSVNGWAPETIHLKKGESEVPLPSCKAPQGGWLVTLVRRTESWEGIATFEGMLLPKGCKLLAPPTWPERKMMFIGDSITCGEYLDRMPPQYDNTPAVTNAARSFGMLLGKWLHAQVHLVSYGGRGVMRDWQGHTNTNNAPQFFPRTMPDDPNSHWNPANYRPDVIVIGLGTNDFNIGLPPAAVYTKKYLDFVNEVHKAQPQAAILLTESPIFGKGPKRKLLRQCIDAVVAEEHAAGDKRIAVAPISYFPGTKGNAHPVAFQHEQIAEELLGPICSITGWKR